MRKDIVIVDLILILTFILIVLSKIFNFTFQNILQPIFFIFIVIHILQHWKIIIYMTKNTFSIKKSKK